MEVSLSPGERKNFFFRETIPSTSLSSLESKTPICKNCAECTKDLRTAPRNRSQGWSRIFLFHFHKLSKAWNGTKFCIVRECFCKNTKTTISLFYLIPNSSRSDQLEFTKRKQGYGRSITVQLWTLCTVSTYSTLIEGEWVAATFRNRFDSRVTRPTPPPPPRHADIPPIPREQSRKKEGEDDDPPPFSSQRRRGETRNEFITRRSDWPPWAAQFVHFNIRRPRSLLFFFFFLHDECRNS